MRIRADKTSPVTTFAWGRMACLDIQDAAHASTGRAYMFIAVTSPRPMKAASKAYVAYLCPIRTRKFNITTAGTYVAFDLEKLDRFSIRSLYFLTLEQSASATERADAYFSGRFINDASRADTF